MGRLKGEHVSSSISGAHMRPQKSQAKTCSTAGFLCKPQARFLVICQRGTTVKPYLTGTGWRQICGSLHEPTVAGTKWYENFERSSEFGGCSIPIPALQKSYLTIGKNLKQRECQAWSGKWDPRPAEGSRLRGMCSELLHHLWRAEQSLKVIWDVTRKWDNDTFERQLYERDRVTKEGQSYLLDHTDRKHQK